MSRGFIGDWQTSRQAKRKPINAVEGVIGIVILLSYHCGGKNVFPKDVNPDMFIDDISWVPRMGKGLFMNDEQLSGLTGAMSISVDIERHLKVVTPGSLKNYLSHLRNGKRPNGGGELPVVSTVYRSDGDLIVHPRDFDSDRSDEETWEKVPEWVRLLIERQESDKE